MTIAILTDFGTTDIYVGVMKGVMLNIAPHMPLVDITHEVRPQDVRQGAFLLLNSYRYFAPGTVFLCVVDPGVGSTRQPIAVQAGGYTFVAPDNGLLSWVLAELGEARAAALTNPAYRLPDVSLSFHGRDIFAPAAAYLANGVSLEQFGVPLERLAVLETPRLTADNARIEGEVLDIDHFGNIITSIGRLVWEAADRLRLQPRFGGEGRVLSASTVTIRVSGEMLSGVRRTYSETARGDLLAMVGSSGFLEIAVNQGNAVVRLHAAPGDAVSVEMG